MTDKIVQVERIGTRYEHCTLDNFDASENPEALQACRDVLEEKTSGLLLYGGVGRGKSHLLAGIAVGAFREARGETVTENGFQKYKMIPARWAMYYPVLDLAFDLRAEAARHENGRIAAACKDAPLFLLDDLGAEKTTDFVIEALEWIIDNRYRWKRPMVVATNMNLDAIVERYGDRALSRWAQGGRFVEMRGRDRRPEVGR